MSHHGDGRRSAPGVGRFAAAGCALSLALASAHAGPREDRASIRAARAASNAAIARHDADAAVAPMRPDVRVLGSGGGLVPDRATMHKAFQITFANPDFVTFVRSPERIEVAGDGKSAAEAGHWKGVWRSTCGARVVSGRYLARWEPVGTAWQIVSEMFVPLRETRPCPTQ